MKIILHTAPQIEEAVNAMYPLLASISTNDLEHRHFVLAPDRYTQTFERRVMEKLPSHGSFQTEIFSFRRLLFRLNRNSLPGEYLSSQNGIMVLRRLILNRESDLNMRRSAQAKGFAENLYDLLLKLKYSCPDPDKIFHKELPPRLSGRIADIRLLSDDYREFLSQGYFDSGDLLMALPALCNSENLANTSVYLAGFDQFNYWEKQAIVNMARNAENFHLFCSHINGSIYEEANEVFHTITALFSDENIPYKIEEVSTYTPEINFFFRRNENSLSRSITCYRAAGTFDEVQFIAEDIRNTVLTQGLRYHDICVAIANPDSYESLIRKTFDDYEIPCFTNHSFSLSEHPLCRYLVGLLRTVIGRFDRESVLRCLKNPFFEADLAEKDAFENYCLQYGIEFDRFQEPVPEHLPEYESLECVRNRLLSESQNILSDEKNYKAFARRMLEYMNSPSCATALERFHNGLTANGEQEYLAFSVQAIGKLKELLTDMERFLKDTPCTLNEFCTVFDNGLSSTQLSLTPTECDCVSVDDLPGTLYSGAKRIYIIGLQNGFPPLSPSKGLLSDIDIEELNSLGAELRFTQEYQLQRKKCQCIHLCCTDADLILSCVCSDSAGFPPILDDFLCQHGSVTTLDKQYYEQACLHEDKQILTELVRKKSPKRNAKFLVEKVAEGRQGLYVPRDFTNALYEAVCTDSGNLLTRLYDIPKEPEPRNLNALYFRNNLTSVSVIETYYTCPYKHFLRYGLRLQQRPVAELKPVDIGSFLHRVAELFVKNINFNKKTELVVSDICDRVARSEEFYRYFTTDRQLLSLTRMKPECIRFCEAIKEQLQHSRFESIYQESEFNTGATFDSIELPKLDVRIRGKIDRIDRTTIDGIPYFRIIDYKTGNTKYENQKLYSGEKIQLMIYLYALTKNGVGRPAGAYYFPIHDKFRNEKADDTAYQLRGYTLCNQKVFEASDDRLAESGKSSVIPVSYGKSSDHESNATRTSKVLNEEQIEAYMEFACDLIAQAVNNIRDGNRQIHPTEGSCDYCEYLDICKNYRHNNIRRIPDRVTPEDIMELTHEQQCTK